MRKLMSAILATTMAVGMMAGAALADDDSLLVYGIYKAGDQTWFIDEGEAAKNAVEALGGEFVYVDAKMNPEEYLKASTVFVLSSYIEGIPNVILSVGANREKVAVGTFSFTKRDMHIQPDHF